MVLAPGTLVAGRYRIVRELGRGGMGSVYVAEHVNTGGRWALKVMHGNDHLGADRAARFRREARASSRITSENVVRVTDADVAAELEGAPFIVMELLDGEDLEHLLAARRQLGAKETVDILLQVARGLDKAHAVGVVHRDLKPENVFLHRRDDGSTVAKVVDFGISKVLRPEDDPSLMSVTSSGEIMGTPLYMSPEQARAKAAEIGPGTDVWAIGLMAYRMLTGENYWVADTIANLFFQILTDEKPAPSSKSSNLDPAFDAWFFKSCAVAPKNRFASVGEQVAELSQALLGQRILPAGPTPQHLVAPELPAANDSALPMATAATVALPTPADALVAPARLPSSDHSIPGTDSSTPTASTGVTASLSEGGEGARAARASRSRLGAIAGAAVVLLFIGGFALFRAKTSDRTDGASLAATASPLESATATSRAPAAEPSAALVPLPSSSSAAPNTPASNAPIASTTAPSVATSPSSKAGVGQAPRPKPSASQAPPKPHDLFDTQK